MDETKVAVTQNSQLKASEFHSENGLRLR